MEGAVSAYEELILAGATVEQVDAYAHELAEEIRAAAGSPPQYCSATSRLTYRWHARRNADLIDPEKT